MVGFLLIISVPEMPELGRGSRGERRNDIVNLGQGVSRQTRVACHDGGASLIAPSTLVVMIKVSLGSMVMVFFGHIQLHGSR